MTALVNLLQEKQKRELESRQRMENTWGAIGEYAATAITCDPMDFFPDKKPILLKDLPIELRRVANIEVTRNRGAVAYPPTAAQRLAMIKIMADIAAKSAETNLLSRIAGVNNDTDGKPATNIEIVYRENNEG